MSVGRQPVPVLAVLVVEDLYDEGAALDDHIARMDDAYWARFVRQPFSWNRFTIWWVARRWIRPRNIQKE